MDKEKIMEGVRLILEGIGENPEREGLLETPERIARMYEEICGGYEVSPETHLCKTFEAKDTDMIIERDIPFYSMCEHHMMPFFGKIHIAYVPCGKVIGVSKLSRLVEVYARRLQIQEQMTNQIADGLMDILNPVGVYVYVEAEHLCVTMRGVKKPGTKTVTVSSRGAFSRNASLEDRFYKLIHA